MGDRLGEASLFVVGLVLALFAFGFGTGLVQNQNNNLSTVGYACSCGPTSRGEPSILLTDLGEGVVIFLLVIGSPPVLITPVSSIAASVTALVIAVALLLIPTDWPNTPYATQRTYWISQLIVLCIAVMGVEILIWLLTYKAHHAPYSARDDFGPSWRDDHHGPF